MSDISVELFKISHDASAKFDYFLCGVAGTLFAYIAQTYTPQRIEISPSTLEPVALLFLAASFFAGLKRIETEKRMRDFNFQMIEAGENAGSVTQTLATSKGSGNFANASGGEIVDRATLEKLRLERRAVAEAASEALPRLQSRSGRFYRMRDSFLILGFVCILFAKVAEPYQAKTVRTVETNVTVRP